MRDRVKGVGLETVTITAQSERPQLIRVLGLVFGVAVGVGSMIGGGILRTPGAVLNEVPYPAIALALWAFGSLHALLGANVIAEVMTAIPKSGGLFVPARAAFGRPGGLLIGWADWLINVAAIAALSIACGEFVVLVLPQWSGHQGLIGATISLGLFLLNWMGVREGSAAQIVGSAAKGLFLIVLALLIVLMPATSANAPADGAAQLAMPVTFWGLVVAYQLIVGVYAGWANASYFSEEDKQPGKNIPRALFSSVISVGALYLLINVALIHAVPVDRLRTAELPIALAVSNIFGPLSIKIVAAAAIVTIVSCNNANIMVATRILYGLSREDLFPAVAEKVNQGGTPSVALGITAVVSLVLALTGEFKTMFLIVGALGVLPVLVAEASFFKLRRSAPDLPRPYRALGYPLLPLVALLIETSLLVLFLTADIRSGISIIAAVAICVPIGWYMSKKNG